jgi:hypothetical protein
VQDSSGEKRYIERDLLKNFQIYTIAALHTTADGMTAFDNFSNCHLFLENGEKII